MRIACELDSDVGNLIVARPAGKLDAHGSVQLWEVVSPRLTEEQPHLAVDMSDVEYMSSAGIGILVRLMQRAKRLGGTASYCGLKPNVLRVLQICELDSILEIVDSLEEARQPVR
jgi:anti-sigma B factor antagonist